MLTFRVRVTVSPADASTSLSVAEPAATFLPRATRSEWVPAVRCPVAFASAVPSRVRVACAVWPSRSSSPTQR